MSDTNTTPAAHNCPRPDRSSCRFGLTTAATIWAVAGIGIAVGSGEFALAIGSTLLILLCLTLLGRVDPWYRGEKKLVTVNIEAARAADVEDLLSAFVLRGVSVEDIEVAKRESKVEMSVACSANPRHTNEILARLHEREDVASVRVEA